VDVALLDFDCGGEGCGRFVPAARRNGYHGRFLIVAETGEARRAAAAIRSGASGIFLKSESPGRLVEAIRIVAAGGIWLDPEIVRELAEHSVRGGPEADSRSSACVLTDRERKVLLGILGGLTNRKIGAHLGLSESCIKTSIREMFHKTGARRRSQLVRAAIEGPLKPLAGTPSRF
jgi:DNA-binding NarL/FixJ family response regulator